MGVPPLVVYALLDPNPHAGMHGTPVTGSTCGLFPEHCCERSVELTNAQSDRSSQCMRAR